MKGKKADVTDKTNEDIFTAEQIREWWPEVLQTPMKFFVIYMGTLEIMLPGSKHNLGNVKEKKYVGLGQKENLPLRYMQ